MANAIPVLPLVGSKTMVSGPMSWAFSAAFNMATPILSFTLCAGLKLSSLATTRASTCSVNRRRRTRGVFPTSSVTSSAMAAIVEHLRHAVERPF